MDSHPPALVQKSTAANTHNPKTDIVVDVVTPRDIVVAIRRAAVVRIVVPGTAAQSGLPAPSSIPLKYERIEYLFL